MRSRAFRRAQALKKKTWAAKTFKYHYMTELTEAGIGIRAHTPAICSCHMCGNPRKHWKQVTLQERKHEVELL
jgi:hypothetical protein